MKKVSDLIDSSSDDLDHSEACCLCGTNVGLSFCKICQKSFCKVCERRYPSRVIAATLEGLANLRKRTQRATSRSSIDNVVVSPSDADESCCGRKYQRGKNH
jgi:hypothetical protein